MSVNKVILIGNLGKDPEIRHTDSGKIVANFTMATTKKIKGEPHTEWHNIVAWNKTAEVCGDYLKKGKQVYVEGELQTRKWQDRDGNDRWTTEIVCFQMQMLGGRDNSEQQSTPSDTPDSDVPF